MQHSSALTLLGPVGLLQAARLLYSAEAQLSLPAKQLSADWVLPGTRTEIWGSRVVLAPRSRGVKGGCGQLGQGESFGMCRGICRPILEPLGGVGHPQGWRGYGQEDRS